MTDPTSLTLAAVSPSYVVECQPIRTGLGFTAGSWLDRVGPRMIHRWVVNVVVSIWQLIFKFSLNARNKFGVSTPCLLREISQSEEMLLNISSTKQLDWQALLKAKAVHGGRRSKLRYL